jgi:hypothetical protein
MRGEPNDFASPDICPRRTHPICLRYVQGGAARKSILLNDRTSADRHTKRVGVVEKPPRPFDSPQVARKNRNSLEGRIAQLVRARR